MTRRKVFIAFAAAVMILVLTAALFVACDKTKTYTVTFKNGETVVKTVSVQDGATIADADVPADLEDTDDAVFDGWFNGDAAFDKTAAITSDVTYTAKWTSIFTVTFKDGDKVVKTAKVKSGEKIASADVPADLEDTDDAEFEGWFNGDAAFDADATITANVTYTSKWSGLLTVTFKDGDQVVKTAKVKSGEKIAAADIPTDLADTADAEFEGWFNGDAAFDKDAAITSNATYTAKWTSIYTVTFQNGDQVVKTAKVKSGEKIAAADIPSDLADTAEAVFEGWFNGDAAFNKDAVITSNVTYTAKWIALYRVTFMNGDQVVKVAKVKSGEKIAAADIPSDLADTADAAFDGWFNGSVAFNKDAAITSNATYTAKWTSIYTVTFQNGDQVVKTAKVKSGAVISAQDVPGALADTDYAFLGWFVGDAAYDSSAAVTSDVVVNAKFSTFFKSYFGTWHGVTEDWDPVAYTVVVDATSINVTIGSADAQAATSINVDEDGTVMFKLGETDYRLYANYDGNLCIYESSEIKLSAELAGRVHVSSSDIVGTYETEGGHTIVINKTFAKVDGVLGTYFSYSNYSGYSWSVDDNYSSLAYDSSAQAWIYKETSSSAGDKLIVPELVAIDVPAEFIGNWYGTVESSSSTSYFLVKVTADGVFAYTPSTGYAKVGVPTEYKDGKLTVVGLDETITASIADGKLAYKSDAAYGADYQLTKGTVVVFEHEYSVYYIATVGADGKINFDTFALEDPQAAAGYTFKGWFSDLDFVTEFNEDATFAESAVFQSKVEKTGYVVTFKKTSSDSDPVIAVVEKTNGKLAADQIPAALTYEDGSVFTGWFTAKGVKAVADLAITADTTFTALAVKESDYAGYWINTTSGKEALAVIADGKVSFEKLARNVVYTYEDGCLKFTVKDSYRIPYNYVISKTNIGITITESYYDRSAEVYVDNIYQLSPVVATTATKKLAGTYKGGAGPDDVIVILENGIITRFMSSSELIYGVISGRTDVTVSYKLSNNSVVTTTGKYDLKSLIVGGKIYVKNPSSVSSYNNSSNGTLYAFAREGKATIYTFKGTDYATIDGELAVGNIVTVTYGEKSFVAKITDTSKYAVAGTERGTYSGVEGNLVLDGFDKAKLGDAAETSYTVNGKGYVLIGEKAYVLKDGAYTVLTEKDGYQNKFKLDGGSVTLELDGFGGVIAKKKSYVFWGTYTVDTAKNEIIFAEVDEENSDVYVDGTYSIVEDGNVYVNTSCTWVKEGYTVENKLAVGYWESADKTSNIEIMSYEAYVFVRIDGKNAQVPTCNYNFSVLTVKVDSKSLEITRDGDNLVYNGIVYSIATRTTDTTKLLGTWQVVHFKLFTFEFLEDGNVNIVCLASSTNTTKTKTVKFAQKDSVYSFEYENDTYLCSYVDGVMTVTCRDSDGYTTFADLTATKIADPEVVETLDAFAGTWKTSDGKFSWIFDGKGNVTNEDGNSFAYTIVSGKAKFSTGALDIECTISGSSMTASYDDGESPFSKTFTKEAAETLDAFAGTWKTSDGKFSWIFDGKGNVTNEDGNSFAYTIVSGKAKFSTGALDIECTISGSSMTASYDDGESPFSKTFTKQA